MLIKQIFDGFLFHFISFDPEHKYYTLSYSEKDEQAYWCKRFSSSWNYEDISQYIEIISECHEFKKKSKSPFWRPKMPKALFFIPKDILTWTYFQHFFYPEYFPFSWYHSKTPHLLEKSVPAVLDQNQVQTCNKTILWCWILMTQPINVLFGNA